MTRRRKNTRRGDGEGSIHQRPNGTWAAQVSLGNDPLTGKRKRRSIYGKTRQEVAKKLTKLLREVQTGTYIEPTKTSLKDWLKKWLPTYKRGNLKGGTYEIYERLIDLHIVPALGKIPLAKLQARQIQNFYNAKQADGGRLDGKPGGLSTSIVNHFHVIIRQALEQAVNEGLLARNVADATNPPVVRSKKFQPLTEAQLLTFFGQAKGDRLFAAYLVGATTGMRRGEICGLCWDSVNLDKGVIIVQRQLVVLKDGLKLEETTKSESGKRNIPLTDDAIAELKAYRRQQAQEKLLLGAAYQDNNLVFCKEDGSFIDPREFTKWFQKHLEAAGLPRVRLHDLRHTHATLLLEKGVHAKIVQERLGHSSITVTLDLYSHVAPGLQEQAARALDGLLKKDPAKKSRETN